MAISAEELAIRAALVENYNNYAEGLDSKQWPLVRACFADSILIDYGPLSASSGAPDVPRRADDWMDYLQGVINGFDITRHTITNHRFTVADGVVNCRAYLSADHIIFPDAANPHIGPQDNITVVGQYSNTYDEIDGQWKIIKSELVVHYTHGNLALFESAAARVAAAAG